MKKLLIILALLPALTLAAPKEKPGVTYGAVITRVICSISSKLVA